MIEENKEFFEQVTAGANKHLKKVGLHPNYISVFSLGCAIFSFIFLIKKMLAPAGLFFILAGLLDWFDGRLARTNKKITKLGAYLDTIIDRYVEAIILLAFLFLPLPKFIFPAYVWIFLALLGSLLTTYAKAAQNEKGLALPPRKFNLVGRGERIIVIVLTILSGLISYNYCVYFLALLAITSNLSAILRIISVIRTNLRN